MYRVRPSAVVLAAACLLGTNALFGHSGASVSAQYRRDESSVVRISVADLKANMAAGSVVVLDVRDATTFAQGHIPGAWLIPVDTTADRIAELKKLGKPIVTYCS